MLIGFEKSEKIDKDIEIYMYQEWFEKLANELLKNELQEILKELTPREAKVLQLRYGLGDNRPHTLEEVVKEFMEYNGLTDFNLAKQYFEYNFYYILNPN